MFGYGFRALKPPDLRTLGNILFKTAANNHRIEPGLLKSATPPAYHYSSTYRCCELSVPWILDAKGQWLGGWRALAVSTRLSRSLSTELAHNTGSLRLSGGHEFCMPQVRWSTLSCCLSWHCVGPTRPDIGVLAWAGDLSLWRWPAAGYVRVDGGTGNGSSRPRHRG